MTPERSIRTIVRAAAILLSLTCWIAAARAQPSSAETANSTQADREASARLEARVEDVARALAEEPRLKTLPLKKRHDIVQFVFGNMLFIVVHELGHAIVSEMELSVLGREEDAADAFAILTGLKIGTAFSRRALVEAAGGWYLSDRRDKKERQGLPFYDEHGLNAQRAYQIVCFLVGSDPVKFKEFANRTKMPKNRQESCKADFATTEWSWHKALTPYLRKPDQPKTPINVVYGEGKGNLALFARSFRQLQFLETIADYASDHFAWPKPFALEMQSCDGKADARWSPSQRRILICYEMAADFAQLFREYGDKLDVFVSKGVFPTASR